jgi:hypothetical protein
VLFRVRRGREAAEVLLRFDEQDGHVSRMRSYSFCPETTREVLEELGLRARTGPYRYPTPEPGRSYGEPGAAGTNQGGKS